MFLVLLIRTKKCKCPACIYLCWHRLICWLLEDILAIFDQEIMLPHSDQPVGQYLKKKHQWEQRQEDFT